PLTHPNDFVYCTSLTGYELARDRVPAYVDRLSAFSPERHHGCSQNYYDPILLERARSVPTVTLRHLTRVDAIEQESNRVLVKMTDVTTGAEETLACRFLVGCDGADSFTAQVLGTKYEGVGFVSNALSVYFRSAELARVHEKGWAKFYRFT